MRIFYGRLFSKSQQHIMSGKEVKYERVEKAHVDGDGNVVSVDVREDQGGEDPGMNFKDKRQADLVPDERVLGMTQGTTTGGVGSDLTTGVTTTRTTTVTNAESVDPTLTRHIH
ncbi:hypothetical protein RvY_16235-2 [Ramazzottius varieornatus]|uniref:Uncharacterized protein n=1 Tax=Ramazzottius varieornatus TaxID=947166 RepID=A0A1D1VXT0_RAMVA|nr:hypothetical protein RvY_16235-2 [Ramazzottius varieornatus]